MNYFFKKNSKKRGECGESGENENCRFFGFGGALLLVGSKMLVLW
jgi:hypothetical protein